MPSAWALPPEINATLLTRMGVGAAAHLPQVTMYTALATAHGTQGIQQAAVATATSASFIGLGGTAMIGQAIPMALWQEAAAAHATAAATTISTACAAYEATAMQMVPPEECVANRMRRAALDATNFLGINTPAIIAHDVQYAGYWANNAGGRTALAATLEGLSGELAAPLPPFPGMSNPAAALAGLGVSIGSAGFAAALGVLGAGSAAATGLAGGAAGVATGLSTSLATGLPSGIPATTPASSPSETTAPPTTTTSAPAPQTPMIAPAPMLSAAAQAATQPAASTAEPAQTAAVTAGGGGEQMISGLVGELGSTLTELPEQALSAASAPLQGVTQLAAMPVMALSSLLSALTTGMNQNSGFSATTPSSSASQTGARWTGVSDVNGYPAGGSPVTASITENSAGGGDGAAPGLPASWGTAAAQSEHPDQASAAAPTAVAQPAAGGVGMVPAAAASQVRRNGPQYAELSDNYKLVVTPVQGGVRLN
jgi:PPE family